MYGSPVVYAPIQIYQAKKPGLFARPIVEITACFARGAPISGNQPATPIAGFQDLFGYRLVHVREDDAVGYTSGLSQAPPVNVQTPGGNVSYLPADQMERLYQVEQDLCISGQGILNAQGRVVIGQQQQQQQGWTVDSFDQINEYDSEKTIRTSRSMQAGDSMYLIFTRSQTSSLPILVAYQIISFYI